LKGLIIGKFINNFYDLTLQIIFSGCSVLNCITNSDSYLWCIDAIFLKQPEIQLPPVPDDRLACKGRAK